MRVEFLTTPPIGTALMLDDQRYELTAVEPYIRKDGTASRLLTWVAQCPDCGGEFAVMTGLKSKDLARRCPEHRQPLKRVQQGARGQGVKVRVIEPAGIAR
jgi:hypothetical protein